MSRNSPPKALALVLVVTALLAISLFPVRAASVGVGDLGNENVRAGEFARGFSSYEREQDAFRLERAGHLKRRGRVWRRPGGGNEAMKTFFRLRHRNIYLTPRRIIDVLVEDLPEGEVGSSDASGGGFSSKAKAKQSGGSDLLPDMSRDSDFEEWLGVVPK